MGVMNLNTDEIGHESSLPDRFWDKVEKTGECWTWTACPNSLPRFHYEGRSAMPGKLAWVDENGPVPGGMCVQRLCRNQRCVRPDHGALGGQTNPPSTLDEYVQRFWSKVDKHGPIQEHVPYLGRCWTWTGGLDSHGYGQFKFRGGPRGAHRMAYIFENGDPGDLVVDHMCHNVTCVRPEHLRAVEVWENGSNYGPHVNLPNVTGFRGVSRGGSRYKAQVSVDGVRHHLGAFDTPEEAGLVASEFRRENTASILDQREEVAA